MCAQFCCRTLHAHSEATIGGGYKNTASGKCVIAVAAQRRSCFVHVLVSVTTRPCACVRSLSPVTVWPCVCHYSVGPYASAQSLRCCRPFEFRARAFVRDGVAVCMRAIFFAGDSIVVCEPFLSIGLNFSSPLLLSMLATGRGVGITCFPPSCGPLRCCRVPAVIFLLVFTHAQLLDDRRR